jgi:hypothetical protein
MKVSRKISRVSNLAICSCSESENCRILVAVRVRVRVLNARRCSLNRGTSGFNGDKRARAPSAMKEDTFSSRSQCCTSRDFRGDLMYSHPSERDRGRSRRAGSAVVSNSVRVRGESRARKKNGRTENKWNCIDGASEGLLRKMNHKWSGRLARTCNRSKEPPDSIASPRPVDGGISVRPLVVFFLFLRTARTWTVVVSRSPIAFRIFYLSWASRLAPFSSRDRATSHVG